MNRLALLGAVALSALSAAVPALAAPGTPVTGVVAALSADGVSVRGANRTVRCVLTSQSPSLVGYTVGDRVQANCRRTAGHLVLTKIRHLPTRTIGSNEAEPVSFAGTVTALSDGSISLHDGDRNLTCTIGDASPSTVGLKVGDHAKVVCVDGILHSWAPVTTSDAAHLYEGVVTAIGSNSITVHTSTQDATCPLGIGSPSVADVHVGDRVLVGCRVGSNLLVLLKRLAALPPTTTTDAGTPTTTTTTEPPAPVPPAAPAWTTAGTLTALSTLSLTVHNEEHGDTTCRLTDGSPRLGDYHIGDHVKVFCADGVLKLIAKF
jgi:hypothetical protein